MSNGESKSKTSQINITWFGQMGYILQLGSTKIALDLYQSEGADRSVPPFLSPEDLLDIDYFIGSHDHYDHIDRNLWKDVASLSDGPKFVLPNLLKERVAGDLGIKPSRLLGLRHRKPLNLTNKISIIGIPCAHEFLDMDESSHEYPYLGSVIEYDGFTLYHSGDTCLYDGLMARVKAFSPLDLMIVPINGRGYLRHENGIDGNMTYQEAVDFVGGIKPVLSLPSHYDMFDGNTEDPQRFLRYLASKYPGTQAMTLPYCKRHCLRE